LSFARSPWRIANAAALRILPLFPAIGYRAGGYYTGFGYQPWSSFTYGSPYGGAITSYNGGIMGPGVYMPYSFGTYTPGFYGGWGWGGGY
jgi:hypothetical protein